MSLDSPLSFQLTFNQYIRDSEGNRIKIKNKVYMAPCNKSNFPDSIYGEGVYELYNLAYAYCPTTMNMTYPNNTCPDWVMAQYPGTDCVTPLHYTVRGSYLSTAFEFIQLNLQACTTSNIKTLFGFKCTTSTVSTLLNSGEYKVNLFYANNVVNPTYYQIPNMTYLETLYWEINPQLSKTADIFLDKEIVQDFDDLWSNTKDKNQTHYSIQPAGMRELNVLQTGSGTAYLQWNIRRSSVSVVTTRTYTKIQDIMTDLGGFAQAVMFVAAFVAMGYVEYKYEMTLSNEFYDFQFAKGEEPKQPPKKKPHAKRKQDYIDEGIESPKFEENEEETDEKSIKKSVERVVEEYREKKCQRKEIEFNLWEYVKKVVRFITCRKNEKDEIAETAKELVEDELDIIRVIQKLKEIDKLKVLLLNRYQREVFNFIEKPLVTLDNDKPIHLDNVLPDLSFELEESKDEDDSQPNQGFLNGREEFNSLSKYGKLYMAYRYLVEDSLYGNQGYNQKLLDMIGEDLIKVFQRVDLLIEENPDPRNFEEIIRQVFDYPEAFGDIRDSN